MGFCNKARKKLRADASLSLSHAIIRYLHPFTYILFPHLFSLDTHSIVTIFHARNSNLRDSLRKLDFSVDNTLSTERTTIRIYIYIHLCQRRYLGSRANRVVRVISLFRDRARVTHTSGCECIITSGVRCFAMGGSPLGSAAPCFIREQFREGPIERQPIAIPRLITRLVERVALVERGGERDISKAVGEMESMESFPSPFYPPNYSRHFFHFVSSFFLE